MPKRLLNGIEAIALSAIEGGAECFASSADATCVGVVQEAARQRVRARIGSLRAEVALDGSSAAETAMAAALDGLRAVWACSHSELYARSADLISRRGLKMRGAFVVVACVDSDASCTDPVSDIRRFAQFAKIPLFDPSDPKQAMAMMKAALELSAEYEIPVIINVSSLVAGTSMFYDLDSAAVKPMPIRSRYNDVYLKSASLDEKIRKIGHAFSYDQSLVGFNRIYDRASSSDGEGDKTPVTLGIACAGAGVSFAASALQTITNVAMANNLPIPAYRVLQVCTPYPYPKRAMYRFVNGLTDILVIEGPDAVIENGMLKDSANNFLAPKITSIAAATGASGLKALTLGIASFLDSCAGEKQQPSEYNPARLVPFVEAELKDAAIYSCSIALPARQPSRFDCAEFALAFEGVVRAAAQMGIPPEKVAVSGIPRYALRGGLAGSACNRFMQAPLRSEGASFEGRLAWARSAARRNGVHAVVLATLREVLVEGISAVMEARLRRFDVTVVVVDVAGAGSSLGVDAVPLLAALGAGIACCDDPRDLESAQRACLDALSMRGVSFALLVEGLSDRMALLGQVPFGLASGEGGATPSHGLPSGSAEVQGEHSREGESGSPNGDPRLDVAPLGDGRSEGESDGSDGSGESVEPGDAGESGDSEQSGDETVEAKPQPKPKPQQEPRVYLDEVIHADMGVNGADSSVPKSVTVDVLDEDGDDLPVSIQNIVQSFDFGSIELEDDEEAAPASPYLTISSLESGPKPSKRLSSASGVKPKPGSRSRAGAASAGKGRGASRGASACGASRPTRASGARRAGAGAQPRSRGKASQSARRPR